MLVMVYHLLPACKALRPVFSLVYFYIWLGLNPLRTRLVKVKKKGLMGAFESFNLGLLVADCFVIHFYVLESLVVC